MLIRFLNILILIELLAAPQPAFAQMMLDSALGALGAGANEMSSIRKPLTAGEIINNLSQQGYTQITIADAPTKGVPLHATAVSPANIPVDLGIEPTTGAIITAVPH